MNVLLLAWVLAFSLSTAHAHGDEDHGDKAAPTNTGASPATPTGNGAKPKRLADGGVAMSKPIQYQLGIRTVQVKQQSNPVAIELRGTVVVDPAAGGRVQASQAGRIEAGPKGLPMLGQVVQKGQVLAYLHGANSSLDRGNQLATLADLQAQYAVAERKAQRYDKLEGVIPQKDIDAARLELDALKKRQSAIAASMNAPEALRAPVSGTIAAAHVALGQVVDAKDVLFEIVDTQRLMIEALAYEPAQASGLKQASASLPQGELALQFVGGARQLRGQALPLLFRILPSKVALAVGQTITVTAQTEQTIAGMVTPRSALHKQASGDTAVWVHDQAEHFAPRVVRHQALDARHVVITSGLRDGDRVVTEGANLLAQVR